MNYLKKVKQLEIARIIGEPISMKVPIWPSFDYIARVKPIKRKPKIWSYSIFIVSPFMTSRFMVKQ